MDFTRDTIRKDLDPLLPIGKPLCSEIECSQSDTFYYSNGFSCTKKNPGPPPQSITTRAKAILVALYDIEAEFKSNEQKLALECILYGETPLIVVLPTGGGKSLLFEGSACEYEAKITIVIVPFIALQGQLNNRAQSVGIASQEWSRKSSEHTSLVFVTVEGSITKEFKLFTKLLVNAGILGRVVIDEAHLILVSSTFRWAYYYLDWFSSIGVQCVFLTATLPPHMEEDFKLAAFIKNANLIRGSSNRPNLAYKVLIIPASKLYEKLLHKVSLFQTSTRGSNKKAIIYTRSVKDCFEVATKLNCGMYFADYLAKEQDLENWMYGESSIIVATTALGAGIDIASICLVIYYKSPYLLFEIVQGSGRAGRDGGLAQSITLISPGELKRRGKFEFPQDAKALNTYLSTKGCRRAELNAYFDGDRKSCVPTVDVLCDNCNRSRSVLSRAAKLLAPSPTGSVLHNTALKDLSIRVPSKRKRCEGSSQVAKNHRTAEVNNSNPSPNEINIGRQNTTVGRQKASFPPLRKIARVSTKVSIPISPAPQSSWRAIAEVLPSLLFSCRFCWVETKEVAELNHKAQSCKGYAHMKNGLFSCTWEMFESWSKNFTIHGNNTCPTCYLPSHFCPYTLWCIHGSNFATPVAYMALFIPWLKVIVEDLMGLMKGEQLDPIEYTRWLCQETYHHGKLSINLTRVIEGAMNGC